MNAIVTKTKKLTKNVTYTNIFEFLNCATNVKLKKWMASRIN